MPATRTLQPFQEAIDALRARLGNQLGTNTWRDIQREAHDRAFVVAGAMKADLLAELAAAVNESISKGLGLKYFRKQFDAIVDKHGWAYKGARNWRTRIIYGTNLRVSQAAGRLRQLRDPDLQKLMPFWKYVHDDSVLHPRPLHQSWDDLILPADDPWFRTHYPPNGWGCHCRITAVTKSEAARSKKRTPPDDGTRTIDGREVPNGIDDGWDYMPGANANGELDRILEAKRAALPAPLDAAMRRETPNLIDAFVESTEAQVNTILQDTIKLVEKVHATRSMPPITFVREVKELGRYNHINRTLGIDPASAAVAPEFVALHELGHAFDYNFIGTLGPAGLQWPNELLSLSSAIKASKTYRELLASKIKRRGYLLQENELWARVYSQWIATLTGDAKALAGLRYHQSHALDSVRLWHWPDDDFADIASALDRYFKRKGLR